MCDICDDTYIIVFLCVIYWLIIKSIWDYIVNFLLRCVTHSNVVLCTTLIVITCHCINYESAKYTHDVTGSTAIRSVLSSGTWVIPYAIITVARTPLYISPPCTYLSRYSVYYKHCVIMFQLSILSHESVFVISLIWAV